MRERPEKMDPGHPEITVDSRQGAEPLFRWPSIPQIEEARTSHIESDDPAVLRAQSKELVDLRNQAIQAAGDLPSDDRLPTVHNFLRLAAEARDLRKVIREPQTTTEEKTLAVNLFAPKRRELQDMVDKHGLSLEKALREYVGAKQNYLRLLDKKAQAQSLKELLRQPSFATLPENEKFDPAALARLEQLTAGHDSSDHRQEVNDVLKAITAVYSPDSPEYQQLEAQILTDQEKPLPRSKADLAREINKLEQEAGMLWQDLMVRNIAHMREMKNYLEALNRGDDVLETPSVIQTLNSLHEWETLHARTTIGGVLVGPPGVGKTTLVRHYLEKKGRSYVYIDLSEDVTRYLLYGSKSLEFKSGTDNFEQLVKKLQGLDTEGFRQFAEANINNLRSVFGALNDQEAAVTFLNQLDEALTTGKSPSAETQGQMEQLRNKVITLARQTFSRELGSEFAAMVKKNGWRDGVIIAALRRGDSVILDEFNKYRNWSLIFGLMTAKPGTNFYFADNDEQIPVPPHWRMYFTANIGRKHGGYVIPEALASRAEGKVIEVGYPDALEEIHVALAALSNPDGIFLRSPEDLAKLYYLIYESFPRIRGYIDDKTQVIPVSYRTLRDIAEKLITARHPQSGRSFYRPTEKTFDEAVYEVMVESYKLYEGQTIPREIVDLLTVQGILLSDSIRNKIEPIIGKDEYEKRRETHAINHQTYLAVVDKIKDTTPPPPAPAETTDPTA